MKFLEYVAQDATALAQRVRQGDVDAHGLLDLALAQQQRVHARINAVCRLMSTQARVQLAQPLSGPLAGVPFLLKDIGQDYAGVPTGQGSRALVHHTPTVHSAVVRRYLAAGLVIFGKTNLPELGLKAVTDSVVWGHASNPWDPARTPGGSSGGAAAAVAAGIVPMAAGNDGGGSIRIPAACCGLFGLRPSRGRISAGPATGEIWNGAASEGVISRSVRDTALALDILRGAEAGDPFIVADPPQAYALSLCRAPARLRIGYCCASPLGSAVHPEAIEAVERAAQLLRQLGHVVEAAAPDIDGAALTASFLHLYLGQVAATVAGARANGARSGQFELLTRVLATLGQALSAGEFAAHLGRWNEYSRALGAFHARYDLYLTPTLAYPPILHGTGDPPDWQQAVLALAQRTGLLALLARAGLLAEITLRMAREPMQYVPFTQLANLTGTPAMSVPLHWTAQGLPLGVQFVARFGAEDLLLQLAAQLEAAQPWFQRLPPWVLADQPP